MVDDCLFTYYDKQMKMTPKQVLFCEHYINNGFNGHKAALAAGYSKKTARNIASENLAKHYIIDHIKKRIKELLSDTEQLTLDWLKNCIRIATADMRKAVEWDAESVEVKDSKNIDDDTAYAINEVSITRSKYGDHVGVKMESKIQALNLLGKYLNILNDNIPIQQDKKEKMSDEDRKKRIAYLLNKKDKK